MQTMSPAELLQSLLQRASAGPTVAGQSPAAPPSLSASTPPAQAPPAPLPPAPSAGSRFGDILRQLAPVLLANVATAQGGPAAAAGLLRGYTAAQEQKRKAAEAQAAVDAANAKTDEERNFKIAQARQAILERGAAFQDAELHRIAAITDPAARAAAIKTSEDHAQRAFGISPGWVNGSIPPLDTHAQDQKRAQDFITQMIKLHGVKGFNDLVANDSIVQNYYGNGKSARAQDILALSGWDVIDPNTGKPMALPQADASQPASAADLITGTGDFENMWRGKVRAQEHKLGRILTPEESYNVGFGTKRTLAGMSGSGASSANLDIPDIPEGSKEFRIAQDLAYGRLTFSQFRGLLPSRSNAAQAIKQAIYFKATQLNPNFIPGQFEAGFKFATNPGVRKQLAALDNVMAAAGDLLKFSDGASRSRWPIINKAIIRGGLLAGDTKYSSFHAAVTAFADELSGALGFGSATDMSRQMGFDMTDPSLSQDQFAHVVRDVVLPFIQRKRDSLVPVGSPEAMYAPNPSGSATQAPTLSPPRQVKGYTVQVEQ